MFSTEVITRGSQSGSQSGFAVAVENFFLKKDAKLRKKFRVSQSAMSHKLSVSFYIKMDDRYVRGWWKTVEKSFCFSNFRNKPKSLLLKMCSCLFFRNFRQTYFFKSIKTLSECSQKNHNIGTSDGSVRHPDSAQEWKQTASISFRWYWCNIELTIYKLKLMSRVLLSRSRKWTNSYNLKTMSKGRCKKSIWYYPKLLPTRQGVRKMFINQAKFDENKVAIIKQYSDKMFWYQIWDTSLEKHTVLKATDSSERKTNSFSTNFREKNR